MRRPLVLAVVLATVAALPAPAVAADPAWTKLDVPFTGLPQSFDLAGLPGRQMLVYWHNPNSEPAANHGMRVVERVPGGAFSAPQEIAETFQSGIAFAPSGDGVTFENRNPGTRTGFRPAGGPPTVPAAFGSGHDAMAVAVASNGKALAAIRTTDGKLRVSDRPAGAAAAFGTPVQTQNDEASTKPSGFFPAFLAPVLDADGAAVIAFSSTGDQLKVVARPAGGSFGAAVNAPVPAGTLPAVASNQAGDAFMVWKEGGVVKGSYRPRGGTFGPAEVVHDSTALGTVESPPVAAIDGSGRVFAAWSTTRGGSFACDPGDRYRMRTAFRAAGGGWSVKPDRHGQAPVVAATDTATPAAARFLLMYRRIDPRIGDCGDLDQRRVVGEVSAYDAVAAPVVLPGQLADDNGSLSQPYAAAMTPAGEGLVLFSRDTGGSVVAAFEGGDGDGGTDEENESPPAEEKPVVPGDGGANNAPVGFTGAGPSGARGPDVGAAPAGGTLGVDPRIFSPVPPPVRVSQLAGGIPLTLGCAGACGLTVSGQVQVGSGGSARAAKVSRIRLKALTVRLKAGERRRVKVKLPKRAIAGIKRAVRRRQRAVAVLTISAPGAKPRRLTVRFRR